MERRTFIRLLGLAPILGLASRLRSSEAPTAPTALPETSEPQTITLPPHYECDLSALGWDNFVGFYMGFTFVPTKLITFGKGMQIHENIVLDNDGSYAWKVTHGYQNILRQEWFFEEPNTSNLIQMRMVTARNFHHFRTTG